MLIAIYVGPVMILFLMGFAVPYALGISAVVGMIYSGASASFRCRRWSPKWPRV